MKTRVERAREKHNAEVARLNRLQTNRARLLDNLARVHGNVRQQVKAVVRSSNRLRKITDELLINSPLPDSAVPKPDSAVTEVTDVDVFGIAKELDDGIPEFLRRQVADAKDAQARQEIAHQQEDAKRSKARGRVAKMLAKRSGDAKKMPLSGRDALAFING
jgi:hypothetical protein